MNGFLMSNGNRLTNLSLIGLGPLLLLPPLPRSLAGLQ